LGNYLQWKNMSRKKALENIFGKLLGSSVKLEDSLDIEEIKFKKQFISTIELFEKVWMRQENLIENFDTNLMTYDDLFFQVIERFIHLCFDPLHAEAILFYIYQRKQDDEIIPFLDEEGRPYIFNTVEDLWDFFNSYEEEEEEEEEE